MLSPTTYVEFFLYCIVFFINNFVTIFFMKFFTLFSSAPCREKSIYRKNPTYVSCCSIELKKFGFLFKVKNCGSYVSGRGPLKKRHRRRNAAQPSFCHERTWKKYFLYFITSIMNPILQNFDWSLYCAKKYSRNMPIFSCSTVV